MFNDAGCEQCRKAWSHPFGIKREDILEQIVRVNYKRQASLYRCKKCGGYWEDPNGNYPTGISPAEATEFYGVS
jgi:uncharacterized protein with PIN domain